MTVTTTPTGVRLIGAIQLYDTLLTPGALHLLDELHRTFDGRRRELLHPDVTETALAKVREDKTREAGDGFDGSWVAHPHLVAVCREIFDEVLGERPNQLHKLREDVHVTAAQLLDVASTPGNVTEAACATTSASASSTSPPCSKAPEPSPSST